ncbi:hypothetical protein [Clostridioides difficile]|uniref:hypothetical protein n=1 Tax=Clostridioides difficile TaxID=1496 RepID=UPI001C15D8C6|nr:InlB B-repeat-containing protein [Clostridioides difficile]HBF6291325.1 InlB B-repeat-containing protein [Clostridioides difficile]HBF6471066.1 InlB B-repeat-containing protein [Clostridioides difficile]HBH3655191.1 InlB B-repeat-containing protein [Clostridioides difficile]HBY2690053.1 InlB B-repeat-containing protein [Clostridioides difficile]
MKHKLKKLASFTLMLTLVTSVAMPTYAQALPDKTSNVAQQFIDRRYDMNGRYQVDFRANMGSGYVTMFSLFVPNGGKSLNVKYVWGTDPKGGSQEGWILQINGEKVSTIYGTSYGFPNGIPSAGITGSQMTGVYSFVTNRDMSGVNWSYTSPNTGSGGATKISYVSTEILDAKSSLKVNYKNKETGDIVSSYTAKVPARYGNSTVTPDVAQVPAGYKLNPESQSKVVNLTQNGVNPNEVNFTVIPDKAGVPEENRVLIVGFKDKDGNKVGSTYVEEIPDVLGSHDVVPNKSKVPNGYKLEPSNQTQTVNLQPTGLDKSVVYFTVSPDIPLVNRVVTINFKDKDSGAIIGDPYTVTLPAEYGNHRVESDSTRVPNGYVLNPDNQFEMVNLSVNSLVPDTVYFTVSKMPSEAERTLTIGFKDKDGNIVGSAYTEVVNAVFGDHIITPDSTKVPDGYRLEPASQSQTVTLDSSGINPNTIYFTVVEKTYRVAYVSNFPSGVTVSGSVPVDTTEYKNGDTVTVLGNINGLNADTYTFVGWSTVRNDPSTIVSGTITMEERNIILYAVWQKN